MHNNEPTQTYHIVSILKGGKSFKSNKVILHKICHQALGPIPTTSIIKKLTENLRKIKRTDLKLKVKITKK